MHVYMYIFVLGKFKHMSLVWAYVCWCVKSMWLLDMQICMWVCACGLRLCVVCDHKHVHVCVFTLYKCLCGGFGVEIEGCLWNSSSSIVARVHNRHLCSIVASVHDRITWFHMCSHRRLSINMSACHRSSRRKPTRVSPNGRTVIPIMLIQFDHSWRECKPLFTCPLFQNFCMNHHSFDGDFPLHWIVIKCSW